MEEYLEKYLNKPLLRLLKFVGDGKEFYIIKFLKISVKEILKDSMHKFLEIFWRKPWRNNLLH